MNNLFKGSWKTSVTGVAALVISALVFFGVFTPDDAEATNKAVAAVVENIGSIVLAVTGVIGLFARDNDVSSEKAGAQ